MTALAVTLLLVAALAIDWFSKQTSAGLAFLLYLTTRERVQERDRAVEEDVGALRPAARDARFEEHRRSPRGGGERATFGVP